MTLRTALQNSTGVTLVEVMVSLVILLVVFIGLIQASLLTIEHNVRNETRDEAVMIASEYMSKTRSIDFTTLTALPATNPCPANPTTPIIDQYPTVTVPPTQVVANPVKVTFRNFSKPIDYTVYRCIDTLNAAGAGSSTANLRVGIEVVWTFKGDTLRHRIYATVGSGS